MVFAWQGEEMPFPATTLRLERLHLAFDMLAATTLVRAHLAPAAGVHAPASCRCHGSFVHAAAELMRHFRDATA